MTATIPTVQTLNSLTLLTPSGDPLDITEVSLKLFKSKGILDECHLSFCISLDLYQSITTETLFHLKPGLFSPIHDSEVQPDTLIAITATLQPQLLSSLSQQATAPDDIINYMAKIAQLSQSSLDKSIGSEHPNTVNETESDAKDLTDLSPLRQTESWFALYIKQQQLSGEVSYRTFWSYLSPTLLSKEISSNGQISATMGHLFQELAKQDKSEVGVAISEAFDDLLQGLNSWIDDQLSSTEETFTNLADEIGQAFESWSDLDTSSKTPLRPSKQPIYRTMLTFFSDDDWAFTKLKGESTLQLGFQNEHGQWNCYAIARDKESQFLFYSVYPTTIPNHQQPTITEYLTRANHGLVQGNFEFDFDNGEIRYKTSLDTTHLSINPKAIQQLVYTNVTIMGHYLPGILAILKQDISATEAIKQTE